MAALTTTTRQAALTKAIFLPGVSCALGPIENRANETTIPLP
jgi:hypothetical protein